MKMPALQNLMRRVAWLGFFGLILSAWWLMFRMNGAMGLDVLGSSPVNFLDLCLSPAKGAQFWIIYGMWGLMMAAMMGPTFVPTARSYEDMISARAATRTGFIGLITGYLLIWLGFAAFFALAQMFLQSQALLDGLGASSSGGLSVILLVIAGLYQFSAAKDACLNKCQSPMVFFLGNWKNGALGGVLMGAKLGVYCLGCCWAMMSLGFIGGVMNLVWMGIATLIMTLEKLPDVGRRITRPLGGVFLLAALLVGANNFGAF
ncbi:MAG: DUF2182 domain-containing protein [Paracoccaceae bacterium]